VILTLKREMKRRELILGGVQLGSLAAIPDLLAQGVTGVNPRSLKARAVPCGLKVGVMAVKPQLQDPGWAAAVTTNFQMLTPGNELKWARVHPTPDTYDFSDADWMVAFAERNRMLIHGHNLCWNADATNPAWLSSTLTKQNAGQYLTQHIATVMGRYKGRIDSWDIVNEPVVPWSKRPDGLYPGIWLNLLGAEYIDIAFHAAAAADPAALRVLNIYYVEQGTTDGDKARRDNLLLLQQCKRRGVPIQAVGIESHLDASAPAGGPALNQFLSEIRALGFQVLITELDVNDTRVPGEVQARDLAVAKCYSDYVLNVVPAGHVERLIFWTVSDKGNWMNSLHSPNFQRPDGSSHRPGLLDSGLMEKPAFGAVAEAITRVCPGRARR
jgi:endo-1,4-beta-xylanase